MQRSGLSERAATVLLIDGMPLRRAAVEALLKLWCQDSATLCIEPVADSSLLAQPRHDIAMIVLSVGSLSVAEPDLAAQLHNVTQMAGNAPIAIMSDLQNTEEVAVAFEAGIRGFLPMSLSPDIAFKILTFILEGGHFFPASALHPGDERTLAPHADNGVN